MEGGGREPTGRRGSSGKTGRCEPESRLRCNAILLFIRQAGEGEEGVGSHASSIYLGATFRGGAVLSLISVRRRPRPDLLLPVRRLIGLDGQTGFRPCRYQERHGGAHPPAGFLSESSQLPIRPTARRHTMTSGRVTCCKGQRLVFTRCPVLITQERFGKDAITNILHFFRWKPISRKEILLLLLLQKK